MFRPLHEIFMSLYSMAGRFNPIKIGSNVREADKLPTVALNSMTFDSYHLLCRNNLNNMKVVFKHFKRVQLFNHRRHSGSSLLQRLKLISKRIFAQGTLFQTKISLPNHNI